MTDEILQCDVAKEDISAYLDGELSGIDAARIEAHLKRCSDCARELELLKEGGKLVRELGERRPSEELERILQRRSRDYLDGFMARRRRSRMVFAARIWARKAIAAALLLAVAGGAVYGVVWLWQTKRADVERAPRTASVDEPLGAREKATEPSRVRPLVGRKPAEREPRELLETVSRETSASYYSGWWNVSYGAPPADIGFAKLMHDGNTVAILGDTYVSGHGTLEGRRMLISQVNTARETGLQLEAEFDVAGRNFAGTAVLSYGGGQYQYPVAIFGEKLAPELATILDAQGKAAETVAQRDDRLKKVYAALKRYAQERDGALPVELSELLPNYLDDESLVTGEPGIRDVAYEGGLSIPQPRTRTVDMPSELAADEALSVRAESSEGSLDPFFTELMSESWKMAPRGRAILYLDGTTRWEEDPASKPPGRTDTHSLWKCFIRTGSPIHGS